MGSRPLLFYGIPLNPILGYITSSPRTRHLLKINFNTIYESTTISDVLFPLRYVAKFMDFIPPSAFFTINVLRTELKHSNIH
jgi:hypothetical protein